MAENLRNLSGKSDKDQIAIMRDRWRITESAQKDQRTREKDDRRFIAGEQWPSVVKAQRDADDLPCLVFNRLQGNVARVSNEAMRDPPTARVRPANSATDVETARVINGLLRQAQASSHSEDALRTGVQNAAIGGRGFYRLWIWENPRTLYDELRWQRIRNPLLVRPDPYAQEIDLSDMRYCFLGKRMSCREFATRYPGADPVSTEGFEDFDDNDEWFDSDTVRVVEYYFTEVVKQDRTRLADGRVYNSDAIPTGTSRRGAVKKTVDVLKTWHYHSNGFSILDQGEFPAPWIPVIPILGEELEVDSDIHYIGVTRNGKDAQRYYNYNKSKIAETVSLAPKNPYVMAEGQEVGHEYEWSIANRTARPYLLYKPTSYDGQLMPPPRREVFEPPIQALTSEAVLAADDIDATSRVHEAARGAPSNETSGVAIAQRTEGSELSNSHFARNMSRSVAHAGRIGVEVIRNIYTEPQVVQILNDDDEQEQVQINQQFEENGQTKLFDLTVGEYDVIADAGPSYKTQREEAVDTLVQLTSAYPDLFKILGDIVLTNMDIPFAKEAATRFKKTIPPELLDEETMPPEEVLITQLRQAMAALQQLNALTEAQEQQMQVLQQALQDTQTQLKDKTRDLDRKDAELQLRARIETGKLEDQRDQTAIKQEAQELDEDEFALDVAKEAQNGIDNR